MFWKRKKSKKNAFFSKKWWKIAHILPKILFFAPNFDKKMPLAGLNWKKGVKKLQKKNLQKKWKS